MPVLDALQWDLSAVTPYSILDHILRTVSFGPMFDPEVVRKHAETFVALAATEHLFSLKSPITVAVACLGAAIRGLNPQSLEVMLKSIFLTCGEIHTVSYLINNHVTISYITETYPFVTYIFVIQGTIISFTFNFF